MSYDNLRMYAQIFDDVQAFRMSCENKIRSGTIHDDAALMSDAIAGFKGTEHQMSLAMRRELRKLVGPNVTAWYKGELGIGEHLFALLLGNLGDPYVAAPYRWEGSGAGRVLVAGEPYIRTVSQLWSYCGHGDPSRRRAKGMTAEEAMAMGNPRLKQTVHLLAEGCVKAGVRKLDHCDDTNGYDLDGRKAISHYGQVYLDARAKYQGSLHPQDCVRCGPSGKPALAGSPRSNSHLHAMSLRKVGKEILRDLWVAARGDSLSA